MLKSQEHYGLMSAFERTHRGRMDKEPKEFWSRGRIYQDGKVNELFLAYRNGYAYFATLDKIAACLARDPKRAERLICDVRRMVWEPGDKVRNATLPSDMAHEIWAAAQLAPGEGIVDGAARVEALLSRYGQAPAANGDALDAARYRWLRKRWARLDESYANGGPEITSLRVLTDQEVQDGYGWDVDPLSLDRAIDANLKVYAQGNTNER